MAGKLSRHSGGGTPAFILAKSRRRTRSRSSHSSSHKSTLSPYFGFSLPYSYRACGKTSRRAVLPVMDSLRSCSTFLRYSRLICSKASRKKVSTSDRWSRIIWASPLTWRYSFSRTRTCSDRPKVSHRKGTADVLVAFDQLAFVVMLHQLLFFFEFLHNLCERLLVHLQILLILPQFLLEQCLLFCPCFESLLCELQVPRDLLVLLAYEINLSAVYRGVLRFV